jgi:uncharacterized membrane protein YdjX (TVP38/TMEM64 family)
MLKQPYFQERLFDIEALRQDIQGGGWSSVGFFVAAGSALNAIGIPRLWICAAGGSLFGALEGGSLGYIASLIGSSINFFMGRSLLRGPLRRNLPRRLRHWYTAFNDHGFKAILYLRLFPLTNGTLTNLLGGASHMTFTSYLTATAIGYLPFTIAFAMMGSSAAKQNGWQLAGGILLFAAVAAGQWAWSYWKKKNRNTAIQAQVLPEEPVDSHLTRKAEL